MDTDSCWLAVSSESGSTASQLVDATLDHISRGDIVSRPQWEDVYTSLAKPQQPDNKASALNMVGVYLLLFFYSHEKCESV